MKGAPTKPEFPLGFQSELRRFQKTQRAYDTYLKGAALGKEALGPSGVLSARGVLDPSFGAFDAFRADHEKALESFRSAVRGVGSPAASDLITGTPRFADITTGVGKGLRDDIAKTARMVGFGGLSEKVEESARIALRSMGTESKAFGVDPDFVRDASSIAFGRPGRTRELLGDDPLGAMGLSRKQLSEQLETLSAGLGPMFSAQSTKATAGLASVITGRPDLDQASWEAAAAIRGIAPSLGAADRFDFQGFLSPHRRGAEGLSLSIGAGALDTSQMEKLSRTAFSLSGTSAPHLEKITRGLIESPGAPWARSGIFGDPSIASALELNSVFGADAARKLRALQLTGVGTLGVGPTMTRGLTRGFGAELDFARGFTDMSAWNGLHTVAGAGWSELRAAAQAAFERSMIDAVEEPEADLDAEEAEATGPADRLRAMGMWLPTNRKKEAAFWFSFLISVNAMAERIAAGDPRQMVFATMGVLVLALARPTGPSDRD